MVIKQKVEAKGFCIKKKKVQAKLFYWIQFIGPKLSPLVRVTVHIRVGKKIYSSNSNQAIKKKNGY